jgi:hypothetical protein
MTAITRAISFTYNSVTVPGTYYLLDASEGKIQFRVGYETGSFTADIIVRADDYTTLNTYETALLAAFRVPRKAFTLTIGSKTVLSWSHSSDTGTNARPTIEKIGSPVDCALARKYRFSVEVDLPGVDTGGRREASVSVQRAASYRRRVEISATYTSSSGTGAWSNYGTNFVTFATSMLAIVDSTVTWQEVEQPVLTFDQENKELRVMGAWIERLVYQPGGALSHASIRNSQLTFGQTEQAPGDSEVGTPVRRLIEVTADFSCEVKYTVTQEIEELWTATIEPWIVAELLAAYNHGYGALIRSSPVIDPENNTIRAEVILWVVGSSGLLEQTYTVETKMDYGRDVIDVEDVSPYAAIVLAGGGSVYVDIIVQRTYVSGTAGSGGAGSGIGQGGGGTGNSSNVVYNPLGMSNPMGSGPIHINPALFGLGPYSGGQMMIGGRGSSGGLRSDPKPGIPGQLDDLTKGLNCVHLGDELSQTPIVWGRSPYQINAIQETSRAKYRFYADPSNDPLTIRDPSGGDWGGGSGYETQVEGRND